MVMSGKMRLDLVQLRQHNLPAAKLQGCYLRSFSLLVAYTTSSGDDTL